MHVVAIDPAQDGDLAATLLAIQRAAYGVEPSLIGDHRTPPLHEEVEELRAVPLNWLGAFDDATHLIGAVAWVEDADEVDINRLVVDPAAHRRGAGRELVQALLCPDQASAAQQQTCLIVANSDHRVTCARDTRPRLAPGPGTAAMLTG